MSKTKESHIETCYQSDIRWLRHAVKPYLYFGLDENDLMQEASESWYRATATVDPASPSFKSYAKPFIRRALLDYAFLNQRIVSFGKNRKVQSLLINMRKCEDHELNNAKFIEEFSQQHNIPVKDVRQWQAYLRGGDIDCYELVGESIPGSPSIIELLCWSEEEALYEVLNESVNKLTIQQQEIIKSRYSDKKETCKSIGERLKLSTTRVWQIESIAIQRLREIVDGIYV